jgi:16S rRNA (guanine527-N7)-methyltransferase
MGICPDFTHAEHAQEKPDLAHLESLEASLGALQQLIEHWPGLTSTHDRRLIDDCLVLLPLLGAGSRLVDVGSGGGLPGLPLKLARPSLDLTMIESNQRKAAFLTMACSQLGVQAEVLRVRAEAAGHSKRLRESFDIATARALAPLPVLAELCLPFLAVGGRLLAMKAAVEAEVQGARRAFEVLGGEFAEIVEARTSLRDRGVVVVVAKVRPTPEEYPRRAGVPALRPLT